MAKDKMVERVATLVTMPNGDKVPYSTGKNVPDMVVFQLGDEVTLKDVADINAQRRVHVRQLIKAAVLSGGKAPSARLSVEGAMEA